ncbi:hypothetical protein H6P81_010193 [Aristolochia fimbriata]|uniref:Uncharacterized protein n=1 Tax=Aristolochia fimbriata TaxID=158543 RepID=A0AAV7ESJ2_ARIFI|nr:hypothetical protein H6P81_010193 [Aristolochia fimbriata]
MKACPIKEGPPHQAWPTLLGPPYQGLICPIWPRPTIFGPYASIWGHPFCDGHPIWDDPPYKAWPASRGLDCPMKQGPPLEARAALLAHACFSAQTCLIRPGPPHQPKPAKSAQTRLISSNPLHQPKPASSAQTRLISSNPLHQPSPLIRPKLYFQAQTHSLQGAEIRTIRLGWPHFYWPDP